MTCTLNTLIEWVWLFLVAATTALDDRRAMLRRKRVVCYALLLVVACAVVGILWYSSDYAGILDGPTLSQSMANQSVARPLTELLESAMFKRQGIKLKWISMRINRLAPSWESTRMTMISNPHHHKLFTVHKRILLFPGLLSEYSAYNFAENAFKGGYVGELIQWSDLIAALYMLGHDITIATSVKRLPHALSRLSTPLYDVLYTDYLGMYGVHDSGLFPSYKCRIRLLDSFGTEPSYNFRTKLYQADKNGDMFSAWGFEDLRQLLTLYPLTPDNSFLGFVMPSPPATAGHPLVKKNQAVIYGKEGMYLTGHEHFIDLIGEQVEVHATLNAPPKSMPGHIINHKVLPSAQLVKLLQESKLFIGLGFPYDGPGPLEALANGCVFVQPQFRTPHSRKNNWFFNGKPTDRKYTSQNPYLETVVGKPKVYTIDTSEDSNVRSAIQEALTHGNFTSFIPHEFTQQGMMERVGAYLAYQDFCMGSDLALGGSATSSSSGRSHSPGEAIDDSLDKESCFWSLHGNTHWWQLELLQEQTIDKIRIVVMFDWLLAKEWNTFINPFQVTLIDSHGNVAAKKVFDDARTFYLWEDVGVRVKTVRIDTLWSEASYLVLCAVEVFNIRARPPLWPHPHMMRVLVSQPDQSCTDTCSHRNMRCEPSYFKLINTPAVLSQHFHCQTTVTMETMYKSFLPAYLTHDDTELHISSGTCVVNGNSLLLSCTGEHKLYKRLCPCRPVNSKQTGLPPQ